MIEKRILGTIVKDQLNDFKELGDTVQRTLLFRITDYKGSSAFITY